MPFNHFRHLGKKHFRNQRLFIFKMTFTDNHCFSCHKRSPFSSIHFSFLSFINSSFLPSICMSPFGSVGIPHGWTTHKKSQCSNIDSNCFSEEVFIDIYIDLNRCLYINVNEIITVTIVQNYFSASADQEGKHNQYSFHLRFTQTIFTVSLFHHFF